MDYIVNEMKRAAELCAKATAGPWKIEREEDCFAEDPEEGEEAALTHPEYVGPLYAPNHKADGDIEQVETDYAFVSEARDLMPKLLAALQKAQRHLIRLHNAGVLSEGQAVQMTGLDRITVLEIADELLDEKAA